ncbi:uncharacterized protein YbjT (DUF2867 family) [Herbaspirillum sp. Sphag1AN]|uniref:NAD(P)H-binding protein n=1 Tax=unclassified Herbaspirillum TaxID=2624150 RepID=UPI00160CF30C|nr:MULTISPECIES: NAD(P)H-binding protein [unclassified Herbaspirillum]MBB3211970.1 uncharacterized protein YbjT (DUF2867 family) [Herbaspirillum sp. Sphag1AN]MBB3244196.1 uncharacterized protein YbjT (DUF2867 family) [Herbaspirillum sp. Sphag64]
MNIAIFGASGMVGQGVLRECLQDANLQKVLIVGRSALDVVHPKLVQLVTSDMLDLNQYQAELTGIDACFFCLGVSSAGMTADQYRHLTYALTVSVALRLLRWNPGMTFVYVSGAGTDSSERGRSMWARIKGETENALLRLPFKAAYMLRPGIILPLDGIQSKTRSYRLFYKLLGPLLRGLQRLWPGSMTTTANVGLAMLQLAREGWPQSVLDGSAINMAAHRQRR